MLEILLADLADPRLWVLVFIISALGLIEKLAIYQAGKRGSSNDLPNIPGIDQDRAARIIVMFETKGTYILLLASIPGLGAAVTAVAGYVGVAIAPFIFWVAVSNLTRNWLIVIFSSQLLNLI